MEAPMEARAEQRRRLQWGSSARQRLRLQKERTSRRSMEASVGGSQRRLQWGSFSLSVEGQWCSTAISKCDFVVVVVVVSIAAIKSFDRFGYC